MQYPSKENPKDTLNEKDVSQEKKWNTGTVKVQVDPTPIQLNKSNKNYKSDKYFVKIKVCRDPTSEKSDLYEIKMAFFDNKEPEEFLLFIRNFNMTIEVYVILKYRAKIQYICTLA